MNVKEVIKDRGSKKLRGEGIFDCVTDAERKYHSADG
jgi:hypothetical protein